MKKDENLDLKKLVLNNEAKIKVGTNIVNANFSNIEVKKNASIEGIKNVSKLNLWSEDAVNMTIYNKATSSTTTDNYTLTVKNINIEAYDPTAYDSTTMTYNNVGIKIKAVKEAHATITTHQKALVKVNGGEFEFVKDTGSEAFQSSVNGAAATDVQ